MEPRFEFTFSYWLFAWFLVYYFGFTKYNPKIWLIIGLMENIITGLISIYYGNVNFLFEGIIINIVIKVLPIYILINTPNKTRDFIAGIVLLFVFSVWMYIRLGSVSAIFNYFKEIIKKENAHKPSTPLINYLEKNRFNEIFK